MKKDKKKRNNNHKNHKKKSHPTYKTELTFAQKAADKLTYFCGSWAFIIGFFAFIAIWMIINAYFWFKLSTGEPFDPYPFILLNLILSCLSAVQAPIILMSQNREAERDRLTAKYDYQINRKAERENQLMMKDVRLIIRLLREKRKR